MMSEEVIVSPEDVLPVESEIELGSSNDVSCEFVVGEKFASFEAFTSKLERYKNKVFAEFWKRDSRTIAGARKRGVDRPIKLELVYHEVKYCCILGGQTFKPKGKGKRCTS